MTSTAHRPKTSGAPSFFAFGGRNVPWEIKTIAFSRGQWLQMLHGKSRQLKLPWTSIPLLTMERFKISFSMASNSGVHHGKLQNQFFHGLEFRCAPWKAPKSVFPWPRIPVCTMGSSIISFSMVEFVCFNHGKLEKRDFHGQIFPLPPWKNPLNHFPWTETGSCSMEILIIKNTMDRLQEKHHGKTRNLDFHGRSSPNCPWNF